MYGILKMQGPTADFIYAVIYLARQARADRATLSPRRDVNWFPALQRYCSARGDRATCCPYRSMFVQSLRIQSIRSRLAVVSSCAMTNLECLRRRRRRDVGPSRPAERLIGVERPRLWLECNPARNPLAGCCIWARDGRGTTSVSGPGLSNRFENRGSAKVLDGQYEAVVP
jgi:hypothetical protein